MKTIQNKQRSVQVGVLVFFMIFFVLFSLDPSPEPFVFGRRSLFNLLSPGFFVLILFGLIKNKECFFQCGLLGQTMLVGLFYLIFLASLQGGSSLGTFLGLLGILLFFQTQSLLTQKFESFFPKVALYFSGFLFFLYSICKIFWGGDYFVFGHPHFFAAFLLLIFPLVMKPA